MNKIIIETVSKAKLVKLLRDGLDGTHMVFPERIDTVLSRTKLWSEHKGW